MITLNRLKNQDIFTKLVILIIIIGILTRFALVIPYHVSGDACWQASNSRFIAANFQIPLYEPLGREQPFWSPPLFHIISAAFYIAFGLFGSGAADFGMKLVTPIFSALSLILAYLILKRLFDKRVVFYSMLFVVFLPMSIDYGVFSYTDGMLVFFSLASIYFALINKNTISAFSLAFAILTKYTGLALIPVVLYIIFIKNRTSYLRKSIITLAITAIISSPWYIRNWIYLKNPVYPILNSFFGGIEIGSTYSGIDFSKLFSLNSIIIPFLEFFGVPNGNPSNLFYFNVPFLPVILIIWLAAIILFILPIFFSFKLKKNIRNIAIVWLLPFFLAGILHILNVGWSIGRRLLPVIVGLAFLWGHGLQAIIKKIHHEKIIFTLLVIIILGFTSIEFAKIHLAANQWNFYQDDFDWVKQNTEKNAIFMAGGQCLSYNMDRFTLSNNIENIDKVDYIWVNQDFKLDPRSILSKSEIDKVKSTKADVVYENKKTNTIIYKIK